MAKSEKMRDGEPGWFATLVGAGVLIAGGFALGLVVGVVSQEPELVVGHLVGRTDEVAWDADSETRFADDLRDDRVAGQPDSSPASSGGPTAAGIDDPAVAQEWFPAAEVADERGAGAPPQIDLPAVGAAPAALRDVAALPTSGSGAEPAAPQRRPRPARGARGWSVQVGAFAEGGAARALEGKLLERGFDAYLVSPQDAGDGRWRVRVGPVPEKARASALADRLKAEERLPTWVLNEGGS